MFLSLFFIQIHAESKYPVDISFMVCDLKYSQEHGIKICEVQHGALSALNGDIYLNGGNGSISPAIANFFDQFPMQKWVTRISFTPLKNSLVDKGWMTCQSIKALTKNPTFQKYGTIPPENPFSISSYAGIVYATCNIVNSIDTYREAYPGVLFLDAAAVPYWKDKYKVNALFRASSELSNFKADWELYPKKYDPQLAARIQQNMPSDLYVIKPRGEFLGNGVIIVANNELDTVLKMILEPKPSLQKHPNERYSYWSDNKDNTLLIEKFYMSDCLQFAHSLHDDPDGIPLKMGGNYHYDATMRIVFMLMYDEGIMSYHSLGGYWKLPFKALEEEGSVNEQRISCGDPPFYQVIDPDLFTEVSAQLERGMIMLYEVMLNGK